MDEPAPSVADGPSTALARWVQGLPPPPFIDPTAGPGERRFAPLSPRVAVLIAAAIVAGLVLWMARDSIRPFILGLLFVYLLEPPVRWLVRRGVRRIYAIVLVYVIGIVLFVEFLALTLTPLVNEVVRFVQDFPKLAAQLDEQLKNLGEFYQRLQIPVALRDWIDGIVAGIGQGGSGSGSGASLSFLLPLITGAGSLLGALFAYFILPVWVAYILKDRVTLIAQFDRAVPETWRFDTWAVIKTVERDFGQWVRGQLILGFVVGIATFVGLIVLSQWFPIFGRYAVLLSVIAGLFELVPIIGPIISAVPAVLLAATDSPAAILAALLLYFAGPAGREQLPRAEDPGQRGPAPPGGGRLRDHHRRVPGRVARGDPGPAGDRRLPRRRPLPVPPAHARRSRRRWPPRSARSGWDRPMPDAIDPYKVLQVDSEAEDEVIQAAYRRLARKYHPDLAATPEAAARMSAINAAWELIGDPAARAAFDRSRTATPDTRHGGDDRAPASAAKAGPAPSQPRPSSRVRSHRRTPRPIGRRGAGARDRVARLDSRALEPGRRLRRVDAQGPGAWCRRPAARSPVRDGAQLRALCGLVARRGGSPRPRIHRVARSRSDRAQLSPGDRRDPALDGPAQVGDERGVRPARAVPPALAAPGGARSGLWCRLRLGRRRSRPRIGADRPIDQRADGRALDQQREEDDAEGDLLEQVALRDIDRQRQGHRDRDRAAQTRPEEDVEPPGWDAFGQPRAWGET